MYGAALTSVAVYKHVHTTVPKEEYSLGSSLPPEYSAGMTARKGLGTIVVIVIGPQILRLGLLGLLILLAVRLSSPTCLELDVTGDRKRAAMNIAILCTS